jgi:hypothetical protein
MNYTKVHMGSGSDIILRSPMNETAHLKIDRAEYFKNLLATTSMHEKSRMVSASPDEMQTTKVKGLPNSINPDKPPKSYKEAMSCEDIAGWAEAYNKEYMGIKQRNVFEVVRIEKGMKLMGMTTLNEYRWSTASSQSASPDCATRRATIQRARPACTGPGARRSETSGGDSCSLHDQVRHDQATSYLQ